MPSRSTMTMASGTAFNPSSKLLQKKWENKSYQQHKLKVKSVKSDFGSHAEDTKRHTHLTLKLKKAQKEEERQADIDRSNRLLVEKMTRIMRGRGRVDNWKEHKAGSLHSKIRDKQREKIAEENIGLARRLGAVRPMYTAKKWEENYSKVAYLKDLWAHTTKDFPIELVRKRQDSRLGGSRTVLPPISSSDTMLTSAQSCRTNFTK